MIKRKEWSPWEIHVCRAGRVSLSLSVSPEETFNKRKRKLKGFKKDLSQLVYIYSRKLKGFKKMSHYSFLFIHLPRTLRTQYHPCRGLFATDWIKLIEIEPSFREFLRISSTASHNLFRTWQQCDWEQKLALREKLHEQTTHIGPWSLVALCVCVGQDWNNKFGSYEDISTLKQRLKSLLIFWRTPRRVCTDWHPLTVDLLLQRLSFFSSANNKDCWKLSSCLLLLKDFMEQQL